jgi:hypothetical protein
MKSILYERNVEIKQELIVRILNAAARIKKHEDQLKRTAHSLRTPDAKCIEVQVGFSKVYSKL